MVNVFISQFVNASDYYSFRTLAYILNTLKIHF